MNERTILASPDAFSDLIGFFLCAIVEEPTCFLMSKPSPASAISDRCRFLISCKIFSHVQATFANHPTYSMYRSLPTTCVVASGTSKPRCVKINLCNSLAPSPCAAPVPTAPKNLPTAILGVASSNLISCLRISSNQTATFKPNVIGTAA